MRFGAACVAAILLAGCKSDPEVTGVRIVAEFGTRTLDQLAFEVSADGLTGKVVRKPDSARGPLTSPQDLVFYLPDALAGQAVVCSVDGLLAGETVVQGVDQVMPLRLRQIATCRINLEVAVPDDAGALPDGAGITTDAGLALDATRPVADGDAATLPRDAPPPGVDVPRGPDLPPGVDAPPPADLPPPADTAGPADVPVSADTAPPADLPPPADTAPVTGCAGNAPRSAFVLGNYPNVASCGAPVSYNEALGIGRNACAPGWHWCRADEVGGLPSDDPGMVAGSTCSWVDGSQATCEDRRTAYPRASCAGAGGMTVSIGGPPSGNLPCLGVAAGCMEPWKLALAFDRWRMTSVTRQGGGCLEHLDLKCTSTTGGASCWITCCRD